MTRTTVPTSSIIPKRNIWRIAYLVLLILALVTRLYALGDRATSHDETTHAKYAWNLYSGRGFRHDPLMHGPLLFEASALFYFLFGVSDFTARLYTALAGVALVMMPWLLRRWLGRLGALLASVMLLISPSISYYSRYTRHDIPLLVATILFFWAILQYFADGRARWLRWMAVAFAFLYVTKENAYMLTAIFGALLAAIFLWRIFTTPWAHPRMARWVLLCLAVALITGAIFLLGLRGAQVSEEGEGNYDIGDVAIPPGSRLSLAAALGLLVAALVLTARGLGEMQIGRMRVFDVLMVMGTLTLPLSSAFLMRFVADLDMTTFYGALMSADLGALATGETVGAVLSLVVACGAAIGLGLWWNRKLWPTLGLLCFGIFFVFYSTLFTWGWGMITGLVGGLAYWMAQQAVERGSQPWYYYLLIGSLYEYLPLLLSVGGGITLGLGILGREKPEREMERRAWIDSSVLMSRLFPFFLIGWAGLSWIAYIVAGEKMPWLFVHIAFPHILLAAWTLDRWFGDLSWEKLRAKGAWLIPISLLFLFLAWIALQQSSGALEQVLQQWNAGGELSLTLSQLQPLGKLIGGAIGVAIFGVLLIWALNRQRVERGLQWILLTFVVALGALTVRTMVMANYLYDELAKEYIVYAHATPDVNYALDRIEAISWRLTGTPDQVHVAYGQDVAWPFYWYMDSRYPNNYYFESSPDAERLLDSPVIVAGREEWEEVEAILGNQYTAHAFNHIWWPVEDYKDLTWERIENALTDPEWRAALWDIAFWRDYTRYARLRNPDDPFTLQDWPHRMEFKLYVRRDLTEAIWRYRLEDGEVAAVEEGARVEPAADDVFVSLEEARSADRRIILEGSMAQGIAASEEALYVADPATHQIWQLAPDGQVRGRWGGYGATPGTFNAPWDVAVGPDGSIYVADTWNHRIQKLDAQGQPVLSWGRVAQVDENDPSTFGAFYGPRGIAVSAEGTVYVADTGNDRVQVFDANGTFLRLIGESGSDLGEFDEPVGLAVGAGGELYVADAWNARIQVFDAVGRFVRMWDVPSWEGMGSDVKPYLAFAGNRVWATDPAVGRLLAFTPQGVPERAIVGAAEPWIPAGVAARDESLYATSPQGGEVLRFSVAGGGQGQP